MDNQPKGVPTINDCFLHGRHDGMVCKKCVDAAKSVEPMLEDFDLSRVRGIEVLDDKPFPIHWAIIGCESGPGRRPTRLEWVRDLVAQCRAAGVPVFIKQQARLELGGAD